MDTKLNWKLHLQISIKQCQIIVGKSGLASFCCLMNRHIQLHQLRCDQQLPLNQGYFQLASFPTIFWWAWSNQSYPKIFESCFEPPSIGTNNFVIQGHPSATSLRCAMSFFPVTPRGDRWSPHSSMLLTALATLKRVVCGDHGCLLFCIWELIVGKFGGKLLFERNLTKILSPKKPLTYHFVWVGGIYKFNCGSCVGMNSW